MLTTFYDIKLNQDPHQKKENEFESASEQCESHRWFRDNNIEILRWTLSEYRCNVRLFTVYFLT
jgi:hypothetical protein